jgi:hypothetical protein
MKIHKSIKRALGYKANEIDEKILDDWKKRKSELCKPCWELKYCPYGPLIEDFPLLPITKQEAKEHLSYLKKCLETRVLGNGKKLDIQRKKIFEEQIEFFTSEDHPDKIAKEFLEGSCKVFGHICPVFFVAEPLTETIERRKHSRSISREVMLKVIRRDGQICQKCNEPVLDGDVEFDHVIPYSKGGESTMENLKLKHRNCNRQKSDSLKEILHPNPIEHLFELRKKKSK